MSLDEIEVLSQIIAKSVAIVLNNGACSPSNASYNYTISQWCDIWLEQYKKAVLRPSTYNDYKSIINNYIKLYFGGMLINSVDVDVMQAQFNSIKNYPRARDKTFTLLKEIFNKAVSLNYIRYNPINNIELPKHKKKKGKSFDNKQISLLKESFNNNKYGDFYYFAMYTGMRRGELLALTRDDINFKDYTISVDKSFNDGNIGFTKTESSKRIIPIIDALKPIANKYKDYSKSVRLFPYCETTVDKHFKRILKSLNITDSSYTLHSLRHTFATIMRENSIDEKVISQWLGHSNISTTLNIYTHINKDYECKQLEKINKGVFGL